MVSKRLVGTRIFKELKKLGYYDSGRYLYTYLGEMEFEERVKKKVSQWVKTFP